MKKLLILSVFTLHLAAYGQQGSFQINGTYPASLAGNKIVLNYQDADKNKKNDTLVLSGSKFQFKGKLAAPQKVTISALATKEEPRNSRRNDQRLSFYLEAGKTELALQSPLNQSLVKAGPEQAYFEAYNQRTAAVKKALDEVYQTYSAAKQAGTDEAMRAYFQGIKTNQEILLEVQKAFFKDYPEARLNLDLLKEQTVIIDAHNFEALFSLLGPGLKNTEEGRAFAEKLAVAQQTAVGKPLIDLHLPNQHGQEMPLSALKGKVVLIEFWASWCAPCRAEAPTLKRAYEQYHPKGFEIYAVSLDDKKEAWLKAIAEDDLPWPQVSDLKGFNSAAAKSYQIRAIPQNILVDEQGTIIAKNLRGISLLDTLAEYYKTH